MALLQRIEVLKDMIQNAIDKGATTVEEVHKSIASIPFDVAQKNGLFEDDADHVKEQMLHSIGYVYDKIREINQQIGDMASDMFAAIEDAQHADSVISSNGRKKD